MKALILSTLFVFSSLAAAFEPGDEDVTVASQDYLFFTYPRSGDNLSGRSSVTVFNATRILRINEAPVTHLVRSLELESPIMIDGKPVTKITAAQMVQFSSGGGSFNKIERPILGGVIKNMFKNNIVEMSDADLKLMEDEAIATKDFSHYKKVIAGLTDRPNWMETETADRLEAAAKRLNGVKGAEGVRYILNDKLEAAGRSIGAEALSVKEAIKPAIERTTIQR